MDARLQRLAEVLVTHSTRVQPGERVIIEATDLPCTDLVEAVIERVHAAGGIPLVWWRAQQIQRCLLRGGSAAAFDLMADLDGAAMQATQCYIGIRGTANSEEYADVPDDLLKLYQQRYSKPVHLDQRVPATRWVVLRYPTPSMAQAAGMSTRSFEDYYFAVCTADYADLERRQQPLLELLTRGRDVRLVAPGTDLTFSIADIPAVSCHGRRNIPDGEVYTAPVRNSVNGTIRYNTGSRYQGRTFQDICFEFRDGRIVTATANQTDALNAILDTDDGARYIGEFSLGTNHAVKRPMLDTLFDEKIGGSLHFTPGNAYTTADNGNRSAVHWDLVLIQTPAFGGGEIWIDGELIRKDGLFVRPDLCGLNPAAN